MSLYFLPFFAVCYMLRLPDLSLSFSHPPSPSTHPPQNSVIVQPSTCKQLQRSGPRLHDGEPTGSTDWQPAEKRTDVMPPFPCPVSPPSPLSSCLSHRSAFRPPFRLGLIRCVVFGVGHGSPLGALTRGVAQVGYRLALRSDPPIPLTTHSTSQEVPQRTKSV